MDVVVIAEVGEFLPRELGVVVGDDRVGYAEAIDVTPCLPKPHRPVVP
jgi:hypothetical protein